MPVVSTVTRYCGSCKETLPLVGDGARRARRVLYLAERDGLRCRYCRIPLVVDAGPGLMPNAHGLHVSVATIDHVVPVCAGGGNTRENQVLACSWCNGKKAEQDWEWLRTQPDFMGRRIEVFRTFRGIHAEEYVEEVLDYVAAHELWFGTGVTYLGRNGGTSVARWHARREAWRTSQEKSEESG